MNTEYVFPLDCRILGILTAIWLAGTTACNV